MGLDIEEIYDARKRLEGIASRTAIEMSTTFSRMSNNNIFLKLENQQKTGSFKIRGATNKIAKIIESGRRPDVIASSAGNHAQGVAYSATKYGLKSTIVMPTTSPLAKIEATRGYGAEIVLYGESYDESYQKACEICKETGAEFIHPYDDADVIAGQGTIGLEILEDLPETDIVLVPAGGGGLLSGIACAIKNTNPNVKVYGIQSEKADAIVQSFNKKKWIATEKTDTIADGIAVNSPGKLTMELIDKYVDGMITVTENSIANAVLLLLERAKHVVEPAGAVTLAAAISGKLDVSGKNIVCVLSGGNIDMTTVGSIIQRGLYVRHRNAYVYISAKNSLSCISDIIRAVVSTDAVILDMTTNRSIPTLPPNQVLIYVMFEVIDADHERQVMNLLKEIGCEIIVSSLFKEEDLPFSRIPDF